MFKTFKNYQPELLEEAYSEGVTIGDFRDYYIQNNNSLQGYQVILPDSSTFKISKEFLNLIGTKISDIPDHQNSNNIIAIDPKELKYKVSRDFSKELGLSISELKKLDIQIFAIGNGSLKTKGSNKGDLAEILFNFVLYTYFLEKGNTNNLFSEFKKVIEKLKISGSKVSCSDDLSLDKKIKIQLNLTMNLKTPAIIDYISNSKNTAEVESNVNQIIHLITTSKKGIWNDVILGIISKTFQNGTEIKISGDGASDSKDDRSDVNVTINQPKKEQQLESISIKHNNKTLTKIAISSNSNVITNLKLFDIVLDSSDEISLEKSISTLNSYKNEVKKASFSSKEKMMIILDQKGYFVALTIFEIILKTFNKCNSENRFLNYVLTPAFFFIKGMDTKIHNNIFSIIDIYKNKHMVLKTKDSYKSEEAILNFEGKKLSFSKGPMSSMKNRVNNIILFYNNQEFFQMRYSARDLDANPRFEIYLEILNYSLYSDILEKLQ